MMGHDSHRVSPFGHPRIEARLQLPEAYRSLPRPSSPLGAKASTVRRMVLDLKLCTVIPRLPVHPCSPSVVKERPPSTPIGVADQRRLAAVPRKKIGEVRSAGDLEAFHDPRDLRFSASPAALLGIPERR